MADTQTEPVSAEEPQAADPIENENVRIACLLSGSPQWHLPTGHAG
jgi:hypothetical protein